MSETVNHPVPRPGILKVFWPAFLGWGSASAVMLANRTPGFWSAAPGWLEIGLLVGLVGAVLGAVFVTIRYAVARGRFAVAVNFSVLIALAIIAMPPR